VAVEFSSSGGRPAHCEVTSLTGHVDAVLPTFGRGLYAVRDRVWACCMVGLGEAEGTAG